ncbi:MAG: ATP-grasp domain-containing protein [Chloroflexi bacterium]|nr:ATP-grasp domain-containing protein [Chloroflexota bacterium]MCI0805351.1 ATP-grasp domain-containing protein [Chloroflexota bacterium]
MASVEKRLDRVNVLFTSVGRRVELIRAFRKAYAELGLHGSIVGTDIDPLAPALQEVDRYYMVPALSDEGYLPTVADICKQDSIQLIFPLIDPDIPVLAQGRERLESGGARLTSLSAPEATTANDKWLTHELFRSIGVPAPRTWPGAPDEDFEFPLYVKPRIGSAGRGGQKVEDRASLEHALRQIPQAIVQEYLSGPEITNDVICGADGRVWAVVSRQRIEVRWGEVAKGVTIGNGEIIEACVKIAEGLKAKGPITVQCLMREGQPYFTEVNARFGGGLPLGIAAGVPSPQWYLSEAAGIPVAAPALGTYKTGLYLTRYDESYFLDESEYSDAESHRL